MATTESAQKSPNTMPNEAVQKNREVFLDDLNVGVTGTIVLIFCRKWDVNVVTGRYLSTDFMASDAKEIAGSSNIDAIADIDTPLYNRLARHPFVSTPAKPSEERKLKRVELEDSDTEATPVADEEAKDATTGCSSEKKKRNGQLTIHNFPNINTYSNINKCFLLTYAFRYIIDDSVSD
nr:hypothetical protein [Tanacetum cinerariifolium]